MRIAHLPMIVAALALAAAAPRPAAAPQPAAAAAAGPAAGPLFAGWRSFTTADGLPSDKVFALAVDGDRLWIGTEGGLALYQRGHFTSWGEAEGLVYPVVTSLAVDPRSGDLWVGTMGGLARFSGGRFENFTQKNSGLANDVVYAVAVEGHDVWAATAAGTSRLDTWTGRWDIFTNRNAPMHEIWCYGLTVGDGKLFLAVWGGGVLRLDLARQSWREFRDPDGQMELDLLRDDGPVSDVVASVAYGDGVLWAGTYFGANRFDGRRWTSYSVDDSGLASDFVNFVVAEGPTAWFATDNGVSHFDGETWTTYRRKQDGTGGIITVRRGAEERVVETPSAFADNFVLAVARRGEELWVGTEKGLSRGLSQSMSGAAAAGGRASTSNEGEP